LTEPDIILCDIISNFTGIDAKRIVIYNQNWKAPKDRNIFIVVSTGNSQIIGETEYYDSDNDKMISKINLYTKYQVELTSYNEEAKQKRHEIFMAIKSTYSLQQQEKYNISIFRGGDILDLSAVDGNSSLHRFQIPVIISHVETKETEIEPIDKFPSQEVLSDG